jgi:DNA invertase Pin-like site-specific DNA recombinase
MGKNTQDQFKMLLFRFLTAIAEFERANIKERQAQGIKLAKERKVYKGKKSKFTKADSDKIIELRKTLTVKEIAKTYDCSQRTIYNLIGNNKF